ncbi:hypothetical protein J6590_102768 [Homalodisca vitripennis]|nr:hypothetical protein J6590_102768 [Homalodisca vitripennis]
MILCVVCLVYKRYTDNEAIKVFYHLEKLSREWPLLNNVTWDENGALLADVTFGGFAIVVLGLLIGQLTGELKRARRTVSQRERERGGDNHQGCYELCPAASRQPIASKVVIIEMKVEASIVAELPRLCVLPQGVLTRSGPQAPDQSWEGVPEVGTCDPGGGRGGRPVTGSD